MRKILFGTTNHHKEIILLRIWKLQGLDQLYELLTLNDIEPLPVLTIPEDTGSFEGDALQKARAYSQASGLITITQDRGFCLTALNDWPGTLSKEVMDPGKNFKYDASVMNNSTKLAEYNKISLDRAKQVLEKLEGKDRTMYTAGAYALVYPNGKELSGSSIVYGAAASEPIIRHENSYSSFFIPNGYATPVSNWDTKEEVEAFWAEHMLKIPPNIISNLIG